MATFIHDSFGEINPIANEGDEVVIASGPKSGIYRYFDLSTFPSFSYRFVGSKQLDLGTPFEDFDSTNDSITIDFWTNRGANDDGRAFAAVLPWIDSILDFSSDSHTINNFGTIDAKLFPAYDSGNSSITLESDWNLMKIDSALDSLSLFSPFTIEYMYNKFNTKNNRIFSINQRFNTLLSLDETGIVYNGTKYNLHVDSDLLSNTDSWTHNVLSYDGFEPRIYKDGNQLVSLTREDSTHFPVGVVEPGRLIDGRAPASFSIKTTIPESDKTLFFCGAETNRLVVRTINLGTQIEISAGTSKQLSLTANVPDNINPHTISWDVNPTPGKIRLWIDSNYQGEASITTSLDNEEWAATAFAPVQMTSFTESKTMITGGITGSTEIATKDRTDGAQFYNRGIAFMDKPAFYVEPDGTYRYIICYPSVVGPMPVGQSGTMLAGGYASDYSGANMSFHRSNDDIGSAVYGWPYLPNAGLDAFKAPNWVAGHISGNGSAYGIRQYTTNGSIYYDPSRIGPKHLGSSSGYWWIRKYYPNHVINPATGINWSENERLNMGLFQNGATEHHGFGHQGYRWRTVPGGPKGTGNFYFSSWAGDLRGYYNRTSVPVFASYVKVNSMTITPGGKNNYYFEVGEKSPGNWSDRYLIRERTYKYYLVKESLIDDPSVFYENEIPSGPRPDGQWVYYDTRQGSYGSYPYSTPHGDGIYNEAVDGIDVSKYFTDEGSQNYGDHREFIISEQDSHFHFFKNGVWDASHPFPSGDGPYKLIISTRGNDSQERANQYSAWRVRPLWDSRFEHMAYHGNTWNHNRVRRYWFDFQGVGMSAGGTNTDYTLYQAVLKFSQKTWRWDPEVAYKNVPDAHRGGVPAATEYTTGVTTYGTPGSAGAYTEITVAAGEPILNYYCGNHSGMGGATDHSAATATTYVVTVASTSDGNKYFLDGVQQALISLAPGATYTFDQSDTSNTNHPIKFSTTANGTHAGSGAAPKTGSLGIDSDGSTWTGTLHSNLLYNKQLFINYSDAELVVGNNLKSVKSLPHETGTQHAIDYVASTGGTIYNWSNPDGAGTSLQQQMSQINDGDAIVIAPGTYTVNNDHGDPLLSGAYGFFQRKNILITGSTNDPTDVILKVGYFAELFSGRVAADQPSSAGLYKELAYLTFRNNPWVILYSPNTTVLAKAYRVNFELNTSRITYASLPGSIIQMKECIISNRASWSNSVWSRYDARVIKWINCIFEKSSGQDPALVTDPRQANTFIGTNITKVGDDIAYNKSKLRLGIPYFKIDTQNPNTPVDKKRYIEDFMIHKKDKYDSISVPFPINRQPFTDSHTKLHIASNMSGGEQLAYNLDGTLIIDNKAIKLHNEANDIGDWHHHSFNYRGSDNVLFSYFDGNKIDSMNIELDIDKLSNSNLLLASKDDYDITSHSIVKSFSNMYIKEMRVSGKMRESSQGSFELPKFDIATDSYTILLDATVGGNPLSADVSPYTSDAKSYRKVYTLNPGIESAEFDPFVSVGSIAIDEEPLVFNHRDGYRPIADYVYKYESDGLLSNPTGYTSIIESDGSYTGEVTGFLHDSLVIPDPDLAFDRSSHIIKLRRFDDRGDSINWSYTKSIPRNTIRLGRYDDDSNSIFYVKAYDLSESNLHWNTDLAFVGKHVDSASQVPYITSGTRHNDSTSADVTLTFEYNGDMGVGITYLDDMQYIRMFDLDSANAIGFDSTQVTFDSFQSYEGYL